MTQIRPKPARADDIDAAIELVLNLAYQNLADRLDNPSEYRRQLAAYELVHDTFSRNGD